MHKISFGCQTYPWKMGGKYFGQVPHMLEVAAKAGFQGYEAEMDMLGEWFDKPAELKTLLDSHGLKFAALVLHQDWNGPGETPEEKALSDKAIAFVKHFPQAKIMLSHHATQPRGEGAALADRREKLIGCMADVAARAAAAGVVCCFHPNSGKFSLFRTEEDYKEMFRLIRPTAIGWAPDVGHIVNGGMDALAQMQANADLIRHVHFKDRIAPNEWAVMGEGTIDYPAIINWLGETGYMGWIMVEDESPKAAADSDAVVLLDGAYMQNYIQV